MKKIPLTQGKFALVDDEDYKELSKYKWQASKVANNIYAIRKFKEGLMRMHVAIMHTPKGMVTDHINGDTLDNRRSNLRICKQGENSRNTRKRINNTSGFKGVSKSVRYSKIRWLARIQINKKQLFLGYFSSPALAYEAYCMAAKKYHGVFARTS